jgi:cytochrome c oxidase cbb3-type subunit IV
MTTFQIIWTLLAFGIFVGIVIWAYSARQKDRFDEAANLPLNDDRETNSRVDRENSNG